MFLLKNKIIIIFILILTTSCTIRTIPFVNHQETLELKLGKTQDMVISIMGQPILVKSGSYVVNDNSVYIPKVDWVYQVRYRTIDSALFLNNPQKTGLTAGSSDPVSNLILTFENNKLSNWDTSSEGIGKPIQPSTGTITKRILLICASFIGISFLNNMHY